MRVTVWTILLSLPLVIQGLVVIRNKNVELNYTVTFYNRCQGDAYRIHTYYRGTLSDCVKQCELRPHCQAMGYHGHMKLCELFTEVETTFTEDGCIYIQQKDIHLVKSPCGTGCEQGMTCDTKSSSCIINECLHYPNRRNGEYIGNRKEVGMKTRLKCVQNYKNGLGLAESICTHEGRWRPKALCYIDCGGLQTPEGAIIVENGGTLQGSDIIYTCHPDFGHVNGTLVRVCQSDGQWSGTEPVCNSGYCYVEYSNYDIPLHDVGRYMVPSFEECFSSSGKGLFFKSIAFCWGNWNHGCFCKDVTVGDGYPEIDDYFFCNLYHRLL